MSSDIVNSLERVPRAGLRSADLPANAPPRSHSQGAAPSRLPADAAGSVPRAPTTSSVATEIGSPHRARGPRTPATPGAARDAEDALHRARLEQENAELRIQLALANQLAASDRRYAELQMSTDATIRELLLSRDESRAQASRLPQPAADTAGVQQALTLAMTNMNIFVQNTVLVANVALGVVVNVKRVNDACAALLRLLGTLRGATEYEHYLRHTLQLPKPGADETGSGFADSARCAVLDTVFNIDARPPSPEGSVVSSASASGTSCQRLISEHAEKVASVLAGDARPGGDALGQAILQHFQTVDSLLYTHLVHLVVASPGSAVYDAVSEQRTFIGAVAALLRCAGHGADQERVRRYAHTFDICLRYTALHAVDGGVSSLTAEQIADVAYFDFQRRISHARRIDLSDMAARLVVAGLPRATGGSRQDLMTGFIQAIMQPDADGAVDHENLEQRLQAVVRQFKHIPLTGTLLAAEPGELLRVLHVNHPATRASAVAAAAVRPGPEVPKPGGRKGQPRQPLPVAVSPPTASSPAAAPPGRPMCELGLECHRTVLERDPTDRNRTVVVARCGRWHDPDQFREIQRKLRVALDAASPVPPAPPVVLPVPAATGTAPSPPARPSQAAILQAYISENRPGKPSVPAVRPEDVDLDAIQEALEGHRLALADCEADARSAPKDDALRRYHLDLLQLWEAHLHAHALVLNLPGDEGVAFLATDAQPEDMVIVDTGSHFNLGPHRMPGENADATGATTGLRAQSSVQRTQTAGGGAVSLHAQYSSQVLLRSECGELILLQWPAHDVQGLGTARRRLHIVSTENVVIDNQGEMVNKPLCKGGSYLRLMATDPQHPDEAAFLTGRIKLDYTRLGAAELSVAVRQPGEHHLLAVLRPSRSMSGGPVALAVRSTLQDALVVSPEASLHVAMAAVREPSSEPTPDSHVAHRRLQQFIASQHLLCRAEEMVEAVHIYHDVDEFDVELEPDQFYSVSPQYFAWDERMSGGAYRRMIQRFSRRLVSQLPPPLYAWLGCTAAQVLAEIEQQLSLLVQGLVKDRSDAVHGDGAAPAPVSHQHTQSAPTPSAAAGGTSVPGSETSQLMSELPATNPIGSVAAAPMSTVAIPAPVSHQRTQPAPTSSAAAGGTSVPGSGTAAVQAAGTSWLTKLERLAIEHDVWAADLNVPVPKSDAIAMPAFRVGVDGGAADHDSDDDDDVVPTAAPGRYGPLAGLASTVSRNSRRAGAAATTAAIFVLCMCAHQLPGRPCLGRPAPGSATCAECLTCSEGRPCVNSERPPFCSAIVPPQCYHWETGSAKAVFLDPACGHLSYSIARLLEAPTAIALAWDVLPPEAALADVLHAYPHLLPRVVYVQVVPGTLITPELVTEMLSSLCDATISDVVELMCGPCCTTTSCRSAKKQNPHRRRIGGVLCPVTYEGALADVFYSGLFDTIRHIRAVNPCCSFIIENPADGLLRELPQVQALLADMPAELVIHDHCVLATEPIDCWHGSTQKPTQYIVIGYEHAALPVSLRCATLGCQHRLSFDAGSCHRIVQQLPGKRRRREGQLRVSAESAARIPVGVFRYAFPLSARQHPAPTAVPPPPAPATLSAPSPATLSAPSPVELEPYGAYLSLRVPADHRLQRLTPRTCVYDATCLHAVCGHTLRGQRLADSANNWQGFRMLGPSGELLSAPNITAAHVRLADHCDVCTRTQMQAAPSHHVHPRAGRQLSASAPVACPAPFGLADISASFLGTSGPWYSEPVPIPSWGQWIQATAASPALSPVSMPALTPEVPAPEEGEACLSESSGYETPNPGRCPTSSDSDPEAEHDIEIMPTFPSVSDRIFTHPGALGSDCRTFAALEMLPDHQRKGRIVHFDIVHSELASPNRPLKAGVKSFLVCVDVGIHHVAFRPIRSTKCIARAYKELAIEQGWTSQQHTCHCVTDGEPGLMAPVRAAAAAMGQSFDTLPPYAANANHAGSHIIKHIRAAVRGYILGASEHPMSVINGSFEAYAWAQAVLIHNMTSVLGHPLHHSPYRLAHGINPIFTSIPFGAKVYIHIPKESRLGARNRGDNPAASRSEPGVAIGPRSQQDPLPLILTSRNTTKASRTTYLAPAQSPHGVIGIVPPPVPVSAAAHVDAAIAAIDEQVQHNQRVRAITKAATKMLTAHDESIVLSPGPLIDRAKPYISQRCKNLIGLSVADALHSTFSAADGTVVSYRRADLEWDLDHGYVLAALAIPPEGPSEQYDSECAQAAHLACLALPDSGREPVGHACSMPEQRARIDALVAIVAMSDLPWKAYLKGPECAHVTAAWYRELNALLDLKAIVPLVPGSPDWEEAVKSKTTTPCRVLLDFKRDGTWKCRVATRGDLEDKVALDGPDFHYYSNVSRMSTVRCAALRAGRDTPCPGRTGGRVISTCDIANAFLQTTPFPESERRFLMIRSPIDGTVTYYRQLISVHGSCSASARWETTFSSWLCTPESEGGPGLVRGMNEPSAYYHPGRDLLMVLYTDDQLLDGYREDIEWYYSLLRARFKIKEPKWLSPDNPIDHLGVGIFMDESHTYMTMQNYIRSMNIVLQRDPSKCLHRKSPIPHKHEIVDMTPLSHTKEAFFVRALGMCSWISATVRLDGRYAQSRISQYASAPCVGAYNSLIHLLDYYTETSHLCIRQSRSAVSDWSFYSDSDMAGNPETVCKRRSQLGYIGLVGEAPIVWSSKCTTVQFAAHNVPAGFAWGRPVAAHPDIADNHADVSSAAAEIYAMGTATMDILALSYVCSEAGILFPRTFVLQVDNAAAQAFASQTTYSGKSRLRHVDARQEWVQVLRDSNLVKAIHVDTTANLSDLFTKALDLATFIRFRKQLMHFHFIPTVTH